VQADMTNANAARTVNVLDSACFLINVVSPSSNVGVPISTAAAGPVRSAFLLGVRSVNRRRG
jgi:hypothetical protein